MRRIFEIALLTTLAISALAGSASAAPTGTVLYAYQTPYVYPNGPDAPGTANGRASMTARYDRCGSDAQCSWSTMAFATRFQGCDPNPYNDPYPYFVWSSPAQAADGTVRSGERRFAMGTPNGIELHTVCLYVLRHRPGGEDDVILLGGRSIAPEPTPPPATPPPLTPPPASSPPATAPSVANAPVTTPPVITAPTAPSSTITTAPQSVVTRLVLTGTLAKHTAKLSLRKKYASWRKGSDKRVRCKRTFSSIYSCSATWRYRKKNRKIRLTVALKNNKAVARRSD